VNPIVIGLIASSLAGLGTGLGALPILFISRLTDRLQGILLGFGGGVMLAASAFSLIVPGVAAAVEQGFTERWAALVMVAGVLLGGWFLCLANNSFPHEHFFKGYEGSDHHRLQRIWLFVIAITLHNFPEGLAVGVGFGTGDISNGIALALGIGLQNIPEGLVVALSLRSIGYSAWYAIGVATLTGLVEPIGGVIGAGIISLAQPLLPWTMAFAAGAMLFVISDEIIPETHRKGFEQEGTLGIMTGFALMMFLDIALG
jgi:zinc transporter, ZIP family